MEKQIGIALLFWLCIPNYARQLDPKVLIVLLVRNKEHTLPHFLKLLEDIDYPKDRIALYIRSDHNDFDETSFILKSWVKKIEGKYPYHSINASISEDFESKVNFPPVEWTYARFRWMMNLKEESLFYGQKIWADWIWFLDADVFITDPLTLKLFVEKSHLPLVAPVLRSLGLYSNFWGGMSGDYYYERTEEYESILERKKIGCYVVPMVHSSFFINLNHEDSKALTFLPENIPNYDGPEDDIIVFALSAQKNGVVISACNERIYGWVMTPLDESKSLTEDEVNLLNLRLETVSSFNPKSLPYDPIFERFVKRPHIIKDKLDFDEVYTINLKRRTDRKKRMEICLDDLGIETKWREAVDGSTLTQEFIESQNIKMMKDFSEPYHQRPLKFGEIGCFLSHYYIWEDIVKNGHKISVVFEDDIRFEPYFRQKISLLQEELEDLDGYWDLVFLGRKILNNSYEPWLDGSNQLVKVDYTYWTLSYILTFEGAKKLIEEKPLEKMIPVDEYLPIMYNRHPNQTWKKHYKNRNLKAFSVHPLLVQPTHYTGEDGYISDTEDSVVLQKDEL